MRKERGTSLQREVPLFFYFICKSEFKVGIMGIVVGKLTVLVLLLDMGMRNLDVGSDKYEVYLLHSVGRNLAERMPRACSSRAVVRHVVGVVHLELICYHSGISLIALGYIEVASNDSRLVPYYLLNLTHDKFGTLAAGYFADVVEVGIHGHKDLTRLLILQFYPTGYTLQSSIPSLGTHHIGGL